MTSWMEQGAPPLENPPSMHMKCWQKNRNVKIVRIVKKYNMLNCMSQKDR